MKRGAKASVCGALLVVSAISSAEPVWITGEVRAAEAEGILVPPSNSSPVVLRYLVPEGAEVKPGDVLVRIDPGQSAAQALQLESQLEILQATVAKDIAILEVAAADAEIALVNAEAAQAKAAIDAGIPRQHLSALDYDRYQGELQRADRELGLKQAELQSAREAVERKRKDAALEAQKLQADLLFRRAEVANAEQRATRAGRITYGFDPWRGTRYEEGASAFPGHRVGDVVGEGGMAVRAYALEPDRQGLQEGQPVQLHFDALPGRVGTGRIVQISGAPQERAQWGSGRYFNLDIELDQEDPALLPGMSVRVVAERGAQP